MNRTVQRCRAPSRCCASDLLHLRLPALVKSTILAAGLCLMASGPARANVIVDVNNALLNIIKNTSASLVDGPPEVAREIALIDGAMFDAVNAASGCHYPFIAYRGSCSEADPKAAALQAALTVMNALYGSKSLYQQYQDVTGASYYPSIPGYAGASVGPVVSDELKSQGLRTDISPANDAFFMKPLISAMAAALGKKPPRGAAKSS